MCPGDIVIRSYYLDVSNCHEHFIISKQYSHWGAVPHHIVSTPSDRNGGLTSALQ